MTNINVEPQLGIIGQSITVNGIGFLPNTSVTITFNSIVIPAVTSDSLGNWTSVFNIPALTYGINTISASDGTNVQTGNFTVLTQDPLPEYCTTRDIADWLRIDINATTNPNTIQVNNIILMNQTRIDYRTQHSWLKNGQTYLHDQAHVPMDVYDYSRGMPIYLKHRFVRPFDSTKGDKVEIWNGTSYDMTQFPIDGSNFIYNDEQKGIFYIKGYLYTILVQNRFRITYRYGGNNEGPDVVPKDIKKACILMTAIDILSTDFKFSQVAYGGEGNVNKKDIIEKWTEQYNEILQKHDEYLSPWN